MEIEERVSNLEKVVLHNNNSWLSPKSMLLYTKVVFVACLVIAVIGYAVETLLQL